MTSALPNSGLEDTLELMADPIAVAEIADARREVAAGHVLSLDELRAKYRQR